uniref:Uncharacterized protein n=1 Tax=Guillardia theta TaxID=55529 RepID=A0A7S4KPE4_GUITH|mmetsp:Transcript_28465/g.91927  ORF Transcript_28465/g.91927 Transcript_28465/m.91927 type:complete len:165 (+) Transcript_28465:166-660(+)
MGGPARFRREDNSGMSIVERVFGREVEPAREQMATRKLTEGEREMYGYRIAGMIDFFSSEQSFHSALTSDMQHLKLPMPLQSLEAFLLDLTSKEGGREEQGAEEDALLAEQRRRSDWVCGGYAQQALLLTIHLEGLQDCPQALALEPWHPVRGSRHAGLGVDFG